MFIIGNFLNALALLLKFVLDAYMFIIIGRVIVSWVSADRYNPIVRFLYEATEPLLSRIRRYIPIFGGGLDLSPLILILAIMFLQNFLVPTLQRIALSIG
jgi:YggT family protein